jgi:hypothetical protein
MGVFVKKGDQEEPGGSGGSGLYLDLEERYCAVCRRALLPWQESCPDDGGAALAISELPSAMPPPPAHLMGDEDEDGEDDGLVDGFDDEFDDPDQGETTDPDDPTSEHTTRD